MSGWKITVCEKNFFLFFLLLSAIWRHASGQVVPLQSVLTLEPTVLTHMAGGL